MHKANRIGGMSNPLGTTVAWRGRIGHLPSVRPEAYTLGRNGGKLTLTGSNGQVDLFCGRWTVLGKSVRAESLDFDPPVKTSV